MSEQGISPVNLAGTMFKIVLIAIFFSVDITYGGQRLPILEHNHGFSQKKLVCLHLLLVGIVVSPG